MAYFDFILNLAGLLLWLNWRSIRFDPLTKRTPATLMGTLRPATPGKIQRWYLLLFLFAMLGLRAVAYRWVVPFWVARLDVGVVTRPFRSDQFMGMLLYSFASFGWVLLSFYIVLLLLSLLRGPDPIHRLVRIPLGRLDGWSLWIKLLLPFIGAATYWWLADWAFSKLPPPLHESLARQFQSGLLIGLQSYLIWKFPLGALLSLHLLNSYIYFGKHPFWNYVNQTARTILRPLTPFSLRVGPVDFAPVVGVVLVFFAAEEAQQGLQTLHAILPHYKK